MTVSEGQWTNIDEIRWHVNSMVLRAPSYGTYIEVQCDVLITLNDFIISNMRKVISSSTNFDDPNKTTVITELDDEIYMTVPYSFVQENRSGENTTEKTTEEKIAAYEEKRHKEWVDSQFSIWDGSHKQFTKLIKNNLNDEKSFKHIETTYLEISDQDKKEYMNNVLKEAGYSNRLEIGDLFLITDFSAKNAYNATVKATAYGISRYSDDKVILLGFD